jgi:hypothetical protein
VAIQGHTCVPEQSDQGQNLTAPLPRPPVLLCLLPFLMSGHTTTGQALLPWQRDRRTISHSSPHRSGAKTEPGTGRRTSGTFTLNLSLVTRQPSLEIRCYTGKHFHFCVCVCQKEAFSYICRWLATADIGSFHKTQSGPTVCPGWTLIQEDHEKAYWVGDRKRLEEESSTALGNRC